MSAPRQPNFLVGYCGAHWTGGAFPSHCKTPERAAATLYKEASIGFPAGDKIVAARITSYTNLAAYHLDLVGKNPSKPESWKVNRKLSAIPTKRQLKLLQRVR